MSIILFELPQTVACIAYRGICINHSKKLTSVIQAYFHASNSYFIVKPRHVISRLIFTSQVRDERARVQSIPLRSKRKCKSSEDRHKSKFVDCLTVKVKAGNGGDGMVSLASLYRNEFAGPDGGKVTLNYFWLRAP